MTLTSLLGVKLDWIREEDLKALELAERIWIEYGQPRDTLKLAEVIEESITRCARNGLWYPPIFLLRKKQLLRGEWSAGTVRAFPTAAAVQRKESACTECGDTGYRITKGGRSATLCECGAWHKKAAGGTGA